MFSLVPRCHGLWRSAKKTGTPVFDVSAACADSSFPRSQVRDFTLGAGSLFNAAASALFIDSAP